MSLEKEIVYIGNQLPDSSFSEVKNIATEVQDNLNDAKIQHQENVKEPTWRHFVSEEDVERIRKYATTETHLEQMIYSLACHRAEMQYREIVYSIRNEIVKAHKNKME